ncbi:hypothetical protein SAMN04488156_104115 [Bacillus sp. 166amftsu]|nr:hypothetical protein SAMN04488156_104115 [Bacillus sp. 166amftsu]
MIFILQYNYEYHLGGVLYSVRIFTYTTSEFFCMDDFRDVSNGAAAGHYGSFR